MTKREITLAVWDDRIDRWTPTLPSFDREAAGPLFMRVVLALLVVVVVLMLVPGSAGRLFLVGTTNRTDPGCTQGCPAGTTVTAVRVRSRGLLAGPGTWGLRDQVHVSVEQDGSAGSVPIVLEDDGAVVRRGVVRRSDHGPFWITSWSDEPADELHGWWGPEVGRSTVSVPGAGAVDRVEVGGLDAGVIVVDGPLSQTPPGVQWLLALAGLVVALRSMRRSSVERAGAVVGAAALTFVVTAGVRVPLDRALGKAYGIEGYNVTFSWFVVGFLAVTALVAPFGGWAVGRRLARRGIDVALKVSVPGRVLMVRLVGAVLAVGAGLLVAQMVDQTFGSVFLGWQL